jgi:cation diffusion facilitator family transporter
MTYHAHQPNGDEPIDQGHRELPEQDAAHAHEHDAAHDHPHDPDHDHPHDADHGEAHPHGQAHDHGESHDHGHADDPDHAHDHPEGRLRRLVGVFVGHSHDPGNSLDDALTSDARGIRALKISLLVLGITAVAQLGVVLVSDSVALLADTIHNFSDALTAIPLWIAFAIGGRAATRRYTFGYRRAEDLAGLFVLLMIAISALLAAYESINRLIDPHPMTNIPIVLVAGIVGFAGNELVALYRIRVGRSIGSAALIADGYHARTDGLTSLAVVGGALGVAAGYPMADALVGLLITAVILVVLKQATGQMLGRLMDAVEPELVEQVERIAASVPEVQSIDRLRLRWLGHALEASMAITVDCDMTVSEGHRVSEEVRHRLLHDVRRLATAAIHVNPCGHAGDDAHALTRHHDLPAGTPSRAVAQGGSARPGG